MADTAIKAIETVYNGYRFRSRLEARWAVFFDALGIKYEYEKEGYDLGEFGWYLPDFYLAEEKTWVEIKSTTIVEDDWYKCEKFAEMIQNDARFRVLIGQIPQSPVFVKNAKGIKGYSYQWFCDTFPKGMTAFWENGPSNGSRIIPMIWVPENQQNLGRALLKARQARFEYGEKG